MTLRAERARAIAKTLVFVTVFVAFVVVYIPWAWAIRGSTVTYEGLSALRFLAVIPLLVGVYVILRCFFEFAWTGLGTPAPFDPPRALVVSGVYRYVRNPMYIGASLIILGETALFGSIRIGLEYVLIFLACTTLFVLIYEEPTLQAKFGDAYEEYCRDVPRFIPRLTPWECKT
jgi:protein-S-isoprenylcysteine O-methyltransferase Ste14